MKASIIQDDPLLSLLGCAEEDEHDIDIPEELFLRYLDIAPKFFEIQKNIEHALYLYDGWSCDCQYCDYRKQQKAK